MKVLPCPCGLIWQIWEERGFGFICWREGWNVKLDSNLPPPHPQLLTLTLSSPTPSPLHIFSFFTIDTVKEKEKRKILPIAYVCKYRVRGIYVDLVYLPTL